ncbi:hypothetical protein ABTD28_19615, partial [Acinetobacter baumannii]
LLAMNPPSTGDMHAVSNAPGAANAGEYNYGDYNHAPASSGATQGLHAKGLTLDSVKGGHTAGGDTHAAANAHGADKHVASADKHSASTDKHVDHKP